MRLRIYYNRQADFPLIWAFDLGTQETELNVAGYQLHGVNVVNGFDELIQPGDREHPRVWMEVRNVNVYEVQDDVLHVYGHGQRMI